MHSIVLFSGGLDSTVLLAYALKENDSITALSLDYNQKHKIELHYAKKIAKYYNITHKIINIDPSVFSSSSIVNKQIHIDKNSSRQTPNTYVPARNTIFLSYALGFAELECASNIYIGVNKNDHTAYPDCRIEYINAFQNLANYATSQAINDTPPIINAPLIALKKSEIILLGKKLNAPIKLSWSCYNPQKINQHCGYCDACIIRKQGFESSNTVDPTLYFT